MTAVDLAKNPRFGKTEGHDACVALLKATPQFEEAMLRVSHGRLAVIVPTKHDQHVATTPSTKTNIRTLTFDHLYLTTNPPHHRTTTPHN